jgi:hypothetical protein
MSAVPTLEDRYRRLLRALPEPARSRWADEMTDTYLTATCAHDPEFAEFGSPDLADRLDVWGLALRLRLGGPGSSARASLTGATVRWVALLGTLAAAAPAALGQLARTLDPGQPWVTGWHVPFNTLAAVLAVAVFGCLVHGSVVARAAAGALLALHLFAAITTSAPIGSTVAFLLPAAVPLLAALALDPVRVDRPRWWWAGALGALLLVGGLPYLSLVLPVWLTSDAVAAVGLTVVGVVAVVRTAAPAAGAVAVLGLLTLPVLLLPLVVGGGPAGYVAVQAGAVALLAATTVVCAVTAVRAVRRLPSPRT